MDFQQLTALARDVRARYADQELERYGRPWSREEVMLGFLGDVGDLARLVQGMEGMEGVRPRADLEEAFAHELADCLWCVMTLADAYDVDLEQAFVSTMHQLADQLGEDRGGPSL